MPIQIAQLALGLVLVVSAVAGSLSPPNREYALAAWMAVALGAALALGAWRWLRQYAPHFLAPGRPATRPARYATRITLDLAILSTVASATTQALVARNLPSPQLAIHNTPGLDSLYLVLAAGLAFVSVWLIQSRGDQGRCWAALVGAALLGSILYLLSFATSEAGSVYGSVLALALVSASMLPPSGAVPRRSFPGSRVWLWGIVFLAAVALAVGFSPVPARGLDSWFKLAPLVALAFILSRWADSSRTWRSMAWGVILIAGLLPIFLAGIKLISLIAPFGPAFALSYRLHLNELGGINLTARSVLCIVPLVLAMTKDAAERWERWLGRGILIGSLFVILYARSWESFFSLLVVLGVYASLVYWTGLRSLGRRLAGQRPRLWLVALAVSVLLLVVGVLSVRTASRLNIYSFNGRLMHWYGAVQAWIDHPWVGGGPSNEMIYAPYTTQVNLLVDTQATRDDPLYVLWINRIMLKLHSHNLFLEIGSTAGTVGFVGFVGFLVALLGLGWRTWRRSTGSWRVWTAGCLSGIVAALVWGVLDVLWVTPPFFSFPVWGLVGLLVGAAGVTEPAVADSSSTLSRQPERARSALWAFAQVALAVGFVLLPSLASASYAAGFVSLQEHRWEDAVSHLERNARYDPLDPQSRQLLAEAHLGQRDATRATAAYERTARLRRGDSHVYAQLGWLAWLRGDVEQAIADFRQAIELDPGEAWREGLHADLGLAYAAQGRIADAVSMFKETIELNPHMAVAPYWRPAVRSDGRFDVVLDPVYLTGPSVELSKRIQVHLGTADVTERLFGQSRGVESPISLHDVLDALYADYQVAVSSQPRQAPLLLSALAEAARLSGLHQRAEQFYREFQSLQPHSAYGFRDLGVLYREQGRLDEAQTLLERAVEVSPRDFASRYTLARVYLDREMLDEAEQALSTLTRQSLVTLFRSRLVDPELYAGWVHLYRAQGDLAQAIQAQRKVAAIRQSPVDYLDLADLYRQQGQAQDATEQCMRATEALLRTWPRPLDPTLWRIGACLGQSEPDGGLAQLGALTREHPLSGHLLLGHVYRGRGQLGEARAAYQQAADARPDVGAPHYLLGETYQALGQPERAEVAYRQAVQLDPLESLPLLALGQMQWGQGQREAALESFQAAVEITPGWGPAHVALGNALFALDDREAAGRHYQLAQTVDGDVHEGLVYDFAAHLAEASIQSPGPDYVRNDHFTINGDPQRVLFMHPEARASYRLALPAAHAMPGGTEEGLSLAFDAAMAPESWGQPGDGVTFAVYVESSSGTEQVFSTYIDPKGDEVDRRWQAYSVDLSAYAGQTVSLVLETGSGPFGDSRFDWAGWGTPRLLAP